MLCNAHRPCLDRHEEGGSAGPLRCGKATTYEGGMRSPALAHWPGTIGAEKTKLGQLISSLDLMPTILSLAGVEEGPDDLMGVDQTEFLMGWGGEVN